MTSVAWNAHRLWNATVALTFTSIAATPACSPFDGVGSDGSALRADGGQPDAHAQASGECKLRRPPARPALDEAAARGADEPTIRLVVYNVDLGDGTGDKGRPSHETVGFDLDGTCTKQDRGHACTTADWAPSSDLPSRDGDDGIDNATGAAFAFFIRSGSPSPTDAANQIIAEGGYSYLLQLEGYNGLADDPKLSAAWTDVVLAKPAGAARAAPTWQGTDEWQGVSHFFELKREPEAYSAADMPAFKYVDDDAYVSGHQLVVRLPRLHSSYGTHSAVQISGTLARDSALGWRLDDATASARVDLDTMLKIVGVSFGAKDRAAGLGAGVTITPVCMDHPMYEERKRAVCSLADVSYDGPDRRSSLCDALSWGWRFDALPAKLVGVREIDATIYCPSGLIPGIDDHCDPSLNVQGAP